jgi:hypothetical protein
MRYAVDRNVVMRRMTVILYPVGRIIYQPALVLYVSIHPVYPLAALPDCRYETIHVITHKAI